MLSTEWLSWSDGQQTIITILSVIRGLAVYTIGFRCFYSLLMGAYKVKEVNKTALAHQVLSYCPEIIHMYHRAPGKRFFAHKIKSV